MCAADLDAASRRTGRETRPPPYNGRIFPRGEMAEETFLTCIRGGNIAKPFGADGEGKRGMFSLEGSPSWISKKRSRKGRQNRIYVDSCQLSLVQLVCAVIAQNITNCIPYPESSGFEPIWGSPRGIIPGYSRATLHKYCIICKYSQKIRRKYKYTE